MKYVEARRKDSLLSKEESFALMGKCEFGFLAMNDNGEPYGLPMSYATDGEKVYFHGAPEGRKIEIIKRGGKVCFCVVGKTRPTPEQFAIEYESAMVKGEISVCTDDDECIHALTLIAAKYSPGLEAQAKEYILASRGRAAVFRMDVSEISGKRKKVICA